jgi:hypothetical protein
MGNAHKDLVGKHGKERPLRKSKSDMMQHKHTDKGGMIWAGLISRHIQAVLDTAGNFS